MTSSSCPRYFALIPAAGVGARMVASRPKQYMQLAGKSMLQHSVTAFLQHPKIQHVFVVVSPDDAYVDAELQKNERLTVLFCGGEQRLDSVVNGLSKMQTSVHSDDWVLVHDAARPGINPSLIDKLIDAIGTDQVGGLLALPVVDTVKMQTVDGESRLRTVPRAGLWLAQTPQMFKNALLLSALTKVKNSGQEITDEASAVEALGLTPKLVEGHWCNTKITRPDDFVLVETYLKQR